MYQRTPAAERWVWRGGETMDDVVHLSSEDSDVEIVGSTFSAGPPPLSSDVTVSPHIIDLTDPRWIFPEERKRKRQHSTNILAVIDLTECEEENGTEKMKDLKLEKSSLRDSTVLAPQQDCGDLKPELSCLDPQNQKKKYDIHPSAHSPVIQITRLPFLEAHVRDLETSKSPLRLTKDCTQTSLSFKQLDMNNDASESMIAASIVQSMEPSLNDSSPKVSESLVTDTQQENSNEFTSTHLHYLADHTSHHFPTARMNTSKLLDTDPLSHRSPISRDQVDPPPTSKRTQAENITECHSDEAEVERISNSPDSYLSIPGEPPLSVSTTKDMDESPVDEAYREDLETDSPLSFFWQEESDEGNEENRFHSNIMAASEEDKHFVCPNALKEIMSGSFRGLINVEYEAFGTPKMLRHQSLGQVYSTIEEDYPEGTLELLSDLLQPGFYPPRDISKHLLHNILLNLQRPHHLCVQAFNLLMRTQRHHMADRNTVPWDWDLLTSVMVNQDCTTKHKCEVVRMFLEYVVQTLEDDFQAKRSVSALHHSITKATLSCDQQFPRVRDVIKWLFSAIVKSTEYGQNRETFREKDEQIRMVLVFQRMLSLALQVDNSPSLSSIKLAQELFHMIISSEPLRAHRMLLLESLQSKLLTCKLLEHLLDYACRLKSSLPMSLSLLLHFLKNCTLTPDPTDGDERWKRWEELVHLLWMLLLSYNVAMKDFLCSSVSKQRDRVSTMVYKPDDKISRSATREAVDAFLSRSQADLGQALPLHVEESLAYLQNHLLDVCQC